MKSKLLSLFLLTFCITHSQIIINPNPFGVNNSSINFTYGSAGDYSIFDPISDTNLYLYTGFETDGITTTWDYHDTWADLSTLVPLTWSDTANAYVATLDLISRNYFSEFTLTNGLIPSGTIINNWYFIIRNASGSRQSIDLLGTDYGFVPGTLNTNFFEKNNTIFIANNQLLSKLNSKAIIKIYSINGQYLNNFEIQPNQTLNLEGFEKGIYIATLIFQNTTKHIKFIIK